MLFSLHFRYIALSLQTPFRATAAPVAGGKGKSRNGGIGRHEGLKIPWPEMAVRVRVPFAAHYKTQIMRIQSFLLSAAAVAALASCSSDMGELSADNFYVTPNPLEAEGGTVSAVIDGKFPEKYMKKKAVVKVTPELRATDGSRTVKGETATFQGEKVLGNNQTISYKYGGTYVMRSNFDYEDALHRSDLYLTFTASVGSKSVDIPDVKVAKGVIATSELYRRTAAADAACFAADSFERVKTQKLEAQVKFLINQAELRKSELNSTSVTEFVDMLRQINRDREKLAMKNIEVKAYASPEGGVAFNDQLASKRQRTSEDYVNKQLKEAGIDTEITGNYTAEDWEGFQKLVEASNIQDKEVILRVLSMYKDPEERERQIRNMSEGFRELADGILPELRRSRMIINYEVVGRSDEQIKQQYKDDASQLSADELLYAATLEEDEATKKDIYMKAAELYPNDSRAVTNAAAIELAEGNYSEATRLTDKALSIDNNSAEANANKGLLALLDGDTKTAETYIAKASGAEGVNKVSGTLSIAKGNYAQAQAELGSDCSNTAALAQILNNDYATARQTLSGIDDKDAMTDYLSAIVSARQNNSSDAKLYLNSALDKDASLKSYANDDLEFSK